MRKHTTTTQFISLSLVLLMAICSVPLSAADTKATSIGAVSTVGSVQLRGVTVNDGTVFSGDRLSVGPGAYARVAATTGQKIEVAAGSDVQVSREGNNLRVQMTSGNVAFTGNGQKLILQLGAYEMTAAGDAAGQVAFVGKETFGVRMTNGMMTVRNSGTKQSFVVTKGTERLVSIATGKDSATMAQLASAAPSAVPAMPTAAARRRRMSGVTGGLLAAAAGAAALITYIALDDNDEARLEQATLLANLTAVSTNATQVATAAAAITTTASAAQTAINNSSLTTAQKATLTTQVNTVTSRASGAAAKVSSLTTKVEALRNTIASQEDGPTDAQQNQLAALLGELNVARDEVNDGVNLLNSLLSQAGQQGVGNLPSNNTGQVGSPTITSASSPL
jgi:hypothetical protein